jgi:hypothetical protein
MSSEPPTAAPSALQILAETIVLAAEQIGEATATEELSIVLLLAAPHSPGKMQCAMQANCTPQAIEGLLRTYIAALDDGSLELESKRRPLPI